MSGPRPGPCTAESTNRFQGLVAPSPPAGPPRLSGPSGLPVLLLPLANRDALDRHKGQQGLEQLRPDAIHRVQFFDAFERSMVFSPIHDPLG